ncbi:MAG TPA: 7TM-DISM domain-containing protein, partial [Ferruginibacter sp.]|nr:7TM-DISM domain-containing protein [Ferruginibacter sp.]
MPLPKPVQACIAVILCLVLQPVIGQTTGRQSFYLYEDSAKNISAEKALDLFTKQKFTRQTKNEFNAGFTRSVFWLAYRNEQDLPQDSLLLYIGHHHINRIHFFFAGDSIIRQQWVTGDYYPFSQRPVIATGFY